PVVPGHRHILFRRRLLRPFRRHRHFLRRFRAGRGHFNFLVFRRHLQRFFPGDRRFRFLQFFRQRQHFFPGSRRFCFLRLFRQRQHFFRFHHFSHHLCLPFLLRCL